ncbi:MarC family protein, partial [Alishewanella sp. HH-ZS]|uniref:MarC family protein n=1 Tax=Alishewanella sp. HH-ZS TaxID=1856684 RepID=UPI000AFF1940
MSVTLLIDYWLIAITALFVVVNPLTTAFIFVSLLPNANAIQRRRAAKRSTLVSACLLITS